MMFNTKTLEVTVDYSRYSGSSVTDSMTFELCKNPGVAMKEKLLFSVRQKCHKVFLDSCINSWQNIHRNIYLVFLLTAYKFHAYALKLPNMQRVQDNPLYFLGIVQDLANLVWNLKNTEKSTHPAEGKSHKGNITWLCIKAFSLKLSGHQSQYSTFLKCLNVLLKGTRRNMSIRHIEMLNKVVGESIPEEFQLMFTSL